MLAHFPRMTITLFSGKSGSMVCAQIPAKCPGHYVEADYMESDWPSVRAPGLAPCPQEWKPPQGVSPETMAKKQRKKKG